MKKTITACMVSIIMVFAFAVSLYAMCGTCSAGTGTESQASVAATVESTVSNTACPVEGNPVTADTTNTTVYNGKTIGFCCADCVAKFSENPEAYAKNLEPKVEEVK